MFDFDTIPADLYRSADQLTCPVFSMTGEKAGPRLVVTGDLDLMRHVADRFWDVPSMNDIRGSTSCHIKMSLLKTRQSDLITMKLFGLSPLR